MADGNPTLMDLTSSGDGVIAVAATVSVVRMAAVTVRFESATRRDPRCLSIDHDEAPQANATRDRASTLERPSHESLEMPQPQSVQDLCREQAFS